MGKWYNEAVFYHMYPLGMTGAPKENKEPVNFDDNPSSEGFANQDGNTAQELYNDDIFVGYRYYDTFGVDVSYPFGYGGSYTSFAMSTKSVKADKDKVTVQVKVKNTGTVRRKNMARYK